MISYILIADFIDLEHNKDCILHFLVSRLITA